MGKYHIYHKVKTFLYVHRTRKKYETAAVTRQNTLRELFVIEYILEESVEADISETSRTFLRKKKYHFVCSKFLNTIQ